VACDRRRTRRHGPLGPVRSRELGRRPDALARELSPNTRVVALNYASNLTGSINDVKTLAKLARDAGALVYVDAVQFSPHDVTDVQSLGCDFLACSSYKFFGPHLGWSGTRGRAGPDARLQGAAVEQRPSLALRNRHAADRTAGSAVGDGGLLRMARALGRRLEARVDRGRVRRGARLETRLARNLVDGLLAIRRNDPRHHRSGPVRVARADRLVHARKQEPAVIAQALASEGIFVWSGHNYALELVRSLGIDEKTGVVRIGLAHYNTPAEVERTLEALATIL